MLMETRTHEVCVDGQFIGESYIDSLWSTLIIIIIIIITIIIKCAAY